MLVLNRRVGEVIQIGDVSVRVVEISGRSVRLGVAAPRDVPVMRAEVPLRVVADRNAGEFVEGGAA